MSSKPEQQNKNYPLKAIIILLSSVIFFCQSCASNPTSNLNDPSATASLKISGDYTGSGIGVFLHDGEPTSLSISSYESLISREVAVVMWFRDFTADMPISSCNMVHDHGSIPMLAWEPWIGGNTSDTTYSLDNINAGLLDVYITKFANDVKSFGKPLFIRFAHEMNLQYYPWSGSKNGNSGTKFIKAWRRIHATFEAVGVTNVTWVWCPNSTNDPIASWNTPEAYYPGDKYVDWVAIDGYNWGTTQGWSSWQTFSQIFSSPYTDLAGLHPSKPFMIGEMSCTKDEGSNSKSAWLTDTFYQIKQNYTKIKAFIWFNLNKECSWEVDIPVSCIASIETSMNDTYYRSTIK